MSLIPADEGACLAGLLRSNARMLERATPVAERATSRVLFPLLEASDSTHAVAMAIGRSLLLLACQSKRREILFIASDSWHALCSHTNDGNQGGKRVHSFAEGARSLRFLTRFPCSIAGYSDRTAQGAVDRVSRLNHPQHWSRYSWLMGSSSESSEARKASDRGSSCATRLPTLRSTTTSLGASDRPNSRLAWLAAPAERLR